MTKTKVDIAQLGHPILRKKALIVDNICSGETQQLIDKLISSAEISGGVGIAAPQIYHDKQIFIMCSKPSLRYPEAPQMKPCAIINPKIISTSTSVVKGWEGCLSVPSMRGLVSRHDEIKVSFYDSSATKHIRSYKGFIARIFQHEYDHLHGKTFIDRLESSHDLISESEWYRQYPS